jgi:pSer/pThr/pTyr-binding forkhead associated (FHA) protein
MKAQVYCRAREGLTLSFDVAGGDADIGRDSQAPVSVPVEGVSRRHARISWDGKSHWLQDLKSTNGTFLNGEVVRRERLRHLDVITLGKAVNLIFVVRGEDYKPVQQGIVAARLIALGRDPAPYALPVGETTLGRSDACNVVTDSGAVSKIHARIERTSSKLTLEDLGSSNGTVVNGSRTRAAVLRHGDEISLAGVESFRVEIEMGEVSAPSGITTGLPAVKAPQEEGPEFSPEWKTRFEWSADEMAELQQLQQKLAARSTERRERASAATEKQSAVGDVPAAPKAAPPKAPPKAAPPKAPPKASPRPAPPKPAPPKTAAPTPPPKAARPEAASPRAEPPQPAAPRPAPPRPAPPRREPKAEPPRAAPPRAEPPRPAAAASQRPTPPPRVEEEADATVIGGAATGAIVEIRLVAPSFDLVANQPGEHRIGRATDAPLRVVHATVSRKHARLIISDDRRKAWVQHDGGANGTRHNGREIDRLEELSDGDQIEIGDVKLRVLIKRL